MCHIEEQELEHSIHSRPFCHNSLVHLVSPYHTLADQSKQRRVSPL